MRKIETINMLKNMGLKVAEAREFKATELKEMLAWANHLIEKYGTFNVRTDLPEGKKAGTNLPFIMNCTISKLMNLVKEQGENITYIVHQHFDVEEQVFNGTLRVINDHVIGEINDIDKTSQRVGLLNAANIKQVCDQGTNPFFKKIKNDILNSGQDAWFELTAYKDGSIVYWQIVQEKITEQIKRLFFKDQPI